MATLSTALAEQQAYSLKPSFLGMLGGELFKITRLWLTWIMLVVLLIGLTGPFLITATSPYNKIRVTNTPLHLMYDEMSLNLLDFRILSGVFLILLTSTVIGQEFQNGTIRILLSRGIGRLQLLLAKFLCIVIIALALFIIGVLVDSLLVIGVVFTLAGNLNALQTLDATFWNATELYLLTVLISMGATILMAVALNVLGRSLTIGMTLAMSWFVVDNVGAEFMAIAAHVTNSKIWLDITAYLLGPNLNDMPIVLIPGNATESPGVYPLVPVSGAHTLWVTLVYSILFIIVALAFMRLRDVRE
jgi:ABC-type transport system involved in multi-copper enzyme maturation permease subunit